MSTKKDHSEEDCCWSAGEELKESKGRRRREGREARDSCSQDSTQEGGVPDL
jgi:hypothetical protein